MSWQRAIVDPHFRHARIVRLVLESHDEGLALTLRFAAVDGAELDVVLTGVEDLRLRDHHLHFGMLVVLMYEDMRAAGWEGVRYRVTDLEEEFLTCYCATITTRT